MKENGLQEIWDRFETKKETKITRDMIEKQIQPRMVSLHRAYLIQMLIYLALVLTSIIFTSMNLPGYRSNPTMLAVQASLLVFSVGCLAYGIFIFSALRNLQNFSISLTDMIRSRLQFLRVHYELWLILIALMANVLSFALNTYVDNMDGHFPIHNKSLVITIFLASFIFIYAVNKLATLFHVRELKSYLEDLENQSLDHFREVEKRRKKLWPVVILFFVILTVMLVWGTIQFLKH